MQVIAPFYDMYLVFILSECDAYDLVSYMYGYTTFYNCRNQSMEKGKYEDNLFFLFIT